MKFEHSEYIKQAIEFAKVTNPIWPFATLIVNKHGKIICKATDCAHISPIFHAETLAIHALTLENIKIQSDLTLYSTAEPDPMSQSAIHWANIAHDFGINKIYFGTSLETINLLWPFGISIPAKEIIQRANSKIELIEHVEEEECNNLFRSARTKQKMIDKLHPAKGTLSNKIEDFYQIL